ncbi:MAG: hypothetical protein K2Q25_10880 [Mycobacteriaceae bacterium]|nr:hypothetical protein [Mycobacteriaceae bacterium]
MTQPDVQVEQEELLQRAAELETPFDPWPTIDPLSPCDLDFVNRASDDLALSAENIGVYLDAGEKSRKDLAASLRNAAKAYENVDENAAESMLNTMGGGSSSGGSGKAEEEPSVGPLGSWYDPTTWGKNSHKSHIHEPDKNPDDYADLEAKARQIEQPDQGVAFTNFANAWAKHQKMLLEAADSKIGLYRPFTQWTGEARSSVEQNFRDMRKWTLEAAEKCDTIAQQAKAVVSAHKVAIKEHPTLAQIEALDKQYHNGNIVDRVLAMDQYEQYQKQSDSALQKYKQSVPGGSQTLGEPPSAYVIDPPEPTPTPGPTPPTPFDPIISDFADSVTPFTPGGAMSQMKEPGDAQFDDELADGSTVSTGGGVMPAAFTGGGSSPTPLKPAAGHETVARSVTGRDAGISSSRPSAGGGAMGGSGMGAAPMGHGGSSKEGQVKHTDDEESLYNEERQWTEGVIGAHRRKDPAEMMADRKEL